jgi:hypothetical protein
MSKRKYRIIEEKYESVGLKSYTHVCRFYPQYKDENVECYILGQDENGKTIESEYQYFGKFKKCGLVGYQWKRDIFYDLLMAKDRIEIDIKEQTPLKLKETIIHEYPKQELIETIIHEYPKQNKYKL